MAKPTTMAPDGVPLEPQPHGGALRRGGTNPGAGRRPAIIRQRALAMFARNLPVLDGIARGVTVEFVDNGETKLCTPRASERVSAMKLLADIGLGEQIAVSDIRDRLRQQIAVLRDELTPEQLDRLLPRLGEVWA